MQFGEITMTEVDEMTATDAYDATISCALKALELLAEVIPSYDYANLLSLEVLIDEMSAILERG
jgi:hypothetical protein